MKYYLLFFIIIFNCSFSDTCSDAYTAFYTYGEFDLEEYIFGEDNCCDQHPIPLCGDDRIYFEKPDYADFTNSMYWDVISDSVAITRGDVRPLYNPLLQQEYQYGVSGAPENIIWHYGPTYGAAGSTAIDVEIPYASSSMALGGIYSYTTISIQSLTDGKSYDLYVTNWTQGNNPGTWPGNGGGNGTGNGGGVSYFRSGAVDASPVIQSITDVPNDQGNRVYLNFRRSMIDNIYHPIGIDSYTIQRFDSPNWVNLGSINANGNSSYIFEATTLADSTSENNALSAFRVYATNYVTNYNLESITEYGYSIDNLAPSSPTNFYAVVNNSQIELSWNHIQSNDLDHYIIERSMEESFVSFEEFETTQNFYNDNELNTLQTYFYRVLAVDHAGNLSDYTETIEVTSLLNDFDQIPSKVTLHNNFPNPFNPKTSFTYDLPQSGLVKINISNLSGSHVKTLINGNKDVGKHTIEWDSKDDHGNTVPAGIYFYTLTTNNYTKSNKMILLK